jgi:hypothetical protein
MVHNIKYLVSYYKANNLSAKGQATQQKKEGCPTLLSDNPNIA